MINQTSTVFILSNEPWGEVWFSKHHYANELSKMGFNVFFVNPVDNWSIKNLFSFNTRTLSVKKNLTVINYKNNFPLRIFPLFFQTINDHLNYNKLFKLVSLESDILIWQFDIFRFAKSPIKRLINRIYHVADPYMNQINDKIIAENCNLIVYTSKSYEDFYTKNYPTKKNIFIPHGISSEDLELNDDEILNIKQKYGEFMLFIGTVSRNVSIDLLLRSAESGFNLVILGPKRDLSNENEDKWNTLLNKPNVFYLGVINGKKIKHWIAASTLCLVPYIFDFKKRVFNSSSSLKILNYLAQKKAVVSTLDGETQKLKNKAIYTAKDESEFINFLQQGIDGTLTVDNLVLEEFIRERDYAILIKKILYALNFNTIE